MKKCGKDPSFKIIFFVMDSFVDLQLATYYGQWYLFYDSINDHKNLLCWRSLICEDDLEMMLQYFNHCVHIVSYPTIWDGWDMKKIRKMRQKSDAELCFLFLAAEECVLLGRKKIFIVQPTANFCKLKISFKGFVFKVLQLFKMKIKLQYILQSFMNKFALYCHLISLLFSF